MARAKRVQTAGYHYLCNFSVGYRLAFVVREDYSKFIELVVELSSSHKFQLHSYVLLSYGYHLLIETQQENLSAIMKLLNSRYAQYFNLKYERNGHLWEGRYRSSYIEQEEYLLYFIRYIGRLPTMTGVTLNLERYDYSAYRQFVGLDSCLVALQGSMVFKQFNTTEEIKAFFTKPISQEEIDNIIRLLAKRHKEKASLKREKRKKIPNRVSAYFPPYYQSEEERVKSMVEAYRSGISQSEIGKFLGMARQRVSEKIHIYRLKENKQ